MIQFNNSFTLIAIARDRGCTCDRPRPLEHPLTTFSSSAGRIVLDQLGNPRMDYALDPYDGLSLLAGIIAGAEVHLTAGANRIVTAQSGVPDYYPAEGHRFLADPKWQEWIALVKKAGVFSSFTSMGSAHQMGSCVFVLPSSSVFSPDGV